MLDKREILNIYTHTWLSPEAQRQVLCIFYLYFFHLFSSQRKLVFHYEMTFGLTTVMCQADIQTNGQTDTRIRDFSSISCSQAIKLPGLWHDTTASSVRQSRTFTTHRRVGPSASRESFVCTPEKGFAAYSEIFTRTFFSNKCSCYDLLNVMRITKENNLVPSGKVHFCTLV